MVHFGTSLMHFAPMYVHADLIPPKMSDIVSDTGPLYSMLSVLPSDAL